jgi:hypothetical protein
MGDHGALARFRGTHGRLGKGSGELEEDGRERDRRKQAHPAGWQGLDGEEVAGNGETVGELGFSGSSWSFRRDEAVSMG